MKDKVLGRLMLIPVIIMILIFEVYPVYKVFEYSLFQQKMLSTERTFVWFNNFMAIFRTPTFWNSFKNNIIWTIGVVGFQLIVGLLVALLINNKFPGRNIVRSLVLFSYIVPVVVTAIAFKFMLTGDYGILNYFLREILHLNTPLAWFSNPSTAMFALIVVETWKHFPFMVIVFLAQLQSIDIQMYEAAKIDGATRFHEFRHITIPFLMPVIFMALIFRTIFEFKNFDLIYLITQGGPMNSTRILPIEIYKLTFDELSLGRGSAVAVIMFIMIMIISIIYIRFYEKSQSRLS